MNILGVGPGEILVVLILMLIVAGPKRMVEWAYHVGRYTAQLRRMFQETMAVIQKELAESGVEVPKELTSLQNTTFDIVREASKIINTEPSPAAPAPSTPPASNGADSGAASNGAASNGAATSGEPTTAEPPAASDTSTTPGSPPNSGSNSQSDNDKPRYDAWTLN